MDARAKTRDSALSAFRWVSSLFLAPLILCSAALFGQAPANSLPSPVRVVAKVNGAPITEAQVQDEMESLYPSNMAHGGLRPEKLKEVRAKATQELIIQELAWQQAVRTQTRAPMAEVRREYVRIRAKYGAKAFDESLRTSHLSRQQYLASLQRRMTLERQFQQKVALPARIGPQALRAYYQKNRQRFQRPEQVRARLILAAVDAKAGPQAERAAQDKINRVYQELQAGKDFAGLAEQYSDDFYRVKGGDMGWTHRGLLEPDFEKVAFSLKPGEISKPFRTAYGYNLLKVEAREPVRQMAFEDVRKTLKYELEQKKMRELRQAWTEQLRKGAKVEVLEDAAALQVGH